MTPIRRVTALVLAASLSLPGPASAALRDRGPVDYPPNLPLEFIDGHGYPKWYRDSTGLALQPCLNDPASPTFGMCLAWAFDPIGYPNNHGAEAFYMAADVIGLTGAGVAGDLTLALEAAYSLGDVPARFDEMVFGRIRIRVDINDAGNTNPRIPADGTWRIVHPYGVSVFDHVAPGRRAINATNDIGITPLQFDLALDSQIGPFLTWDTYPNDESLKFRDGTGAIVEEYVGDPAVPHRVIGSPFGTNVFRIEGPPGCAIGGFDGAGQPIDFIETDLFALSGKKWLKPIPVKTEVKRAVYSRDPGSSQLTVWAAADVTVPGKPVPQLVFTGTGLPGQVPMLHDGQGAYFGNVMLPAPDAPLPGQITLTNLTDLPAPTSVTAVVTDIVTGSAVYDATLGVLQIAAQSSDRSPASPALRVLNFTPGAMAPDPGKPGAGSLTASVSQPPLAVTIVSAAGGSANVPVVPVTDPPVALPDVFGAYEDGPAVALPVFANDTVVAPATFARLRVVQPPRSGGTATPVGQAIEYRPAPGFFGPDSLVYVVEDSRGFASNPAIVTIDVARNAAPIATDDVATTQRGVGVTIDALANDHDDLGAVALAAVGTPSSGAAAIVADRILYTPDPAFVGTDSFTYSIRDAGGKTASATVTVGVKVAPATAVTLTPSVPSPALAGTPVVFVGAGSGSAGTPPSGYDYRFWFNDGTGWRVVQDYGNGDRWTLPASTPEGSYQVNVDVRTSPAVWRDANLSVAYSVRGIAPATAVTLTPSVPSPALAGTPVVFVAAGSGSPGTPPSGYDYRFMLNDGTGWRVVQDWGNGDRWTLPASTPEGSYQVNVDVRTSPTVWRDAFLTVAYRVRGLAPATGVTLTPNPPSPVAAGTPVRFTAAGEGSSGYQYRFWLRAGAGPWVLVQDYGIGDRWDLPTSTAAGSYSVSVDVRTSSMVSRDALKTIAYTVQ